MTKPAIEGAVDGPNLIGVDLGGTKIEVAVLDRAGRFLLRERMPTPRDDYAGTLGAIAALLRGLSSSFSTRRRRGSSRNVRRRDAG